MITHPLQVKAYDAVSAALPFTLDSSRITVEDGVAYTQSPIKTHDYAAGVMAAFGSVVEHLGRVRGLPAQTMTLNRRHCGLLLNSAQMHFLNGYSTVLDTWPVGPDNGTYRAKDGRYVHMIGLHPHLRDALLNYLDCPNSQPAIQAAVEKKTAQQLEDEAAALNLALGIVRSPQEWLAHPQGAATALHQMVDIDHTAGAGTRRLGAARHRPLEGVRVVELTHLVAGPTIGRLLAEQGAEVIKIQPPNGDWVLPLWMDVSWGKRNISLDIKGRTGMARLVKFLSEADVLVSSNRADALSSLGLDDAGLRKINPNLVFVRASCFAKSTPWEKRRGFEQIAQAVSGMMHLHSEGMADPTVVSVLINDYLTGYLGAIGAVAALAEREEHGGYWDVEASLTRCAMEALELVQPQDAEPYAPASTQDLIDFGIDQDTPNGTFTRLHPAVTFSHTPSMALCPTNWPNTHPDTITWTEPANDGAPEVPHYPSKLAREGGIRNLVPCYGIEDRGDGGGGLSLASPKLMEFVLASRK